MAEVQGRKIINNMQIETSSGTVYWQEEEPTNPKDGDTWFKVINGKATNSYNRENGQWVEVAFASQIIAEELIGKIITAAEINGGVINGTTISGAEFINNFAFKESDQVEVTGQTSIIQGKLAHSSTGTVIDPMTEEDLFKGYESYYSLYGGQVQMQNTSYAPDGNIITAGSAILTGEALMLTLTDSSGVYVGRLTAKALTNTPWINLTMGSSYEVKDGNQPQYKIKYNLDGSRTIEFRGAVGLKSGAMTTTGSGTVYRPFSTGNSASTTTIPTSIRPSATVQKIGSTNNTSPGQIGARYAVATNGDFPIWVNGTSTYVDISGMTYTVE